MTAFTLVLHPQVDGMQSTRGPIVLCGEARGQKHVSGSQFKSQLHPYTYTYIHIHTCENKIPNPNTGSGVQKVPCDPCAPECLQCRPLRATMSCLDSLLPALLVGFYTEFTIQQQQLIS